MKAPAIEAISSACTTGRALRRIGSPRVPRMDQPGLVKRHGAGKAAGLDDGRPAPGPYRHVTVIGGTLLKTCRGNAGEGHHVQPGFQQRRIRWRGDFRCQVRGWPIALPGRVGRLCHESRCVRRARMNWDTSREVAASKGPAQAVSPGSPHGTGSAVRFRLVLPCREDVQHRARWLHRGEGPTRVGTGPVQNFTRRCRRRCTQYPRLGRQRCEHRLQKKMQGVANGRGSGPALVVAGGLLIDTALISSLRMAAPFGVVWNAASPGCCGGPLEESLGRGMPFARSASSAIAGAGADRSHRGCQIQREQPGVGAGFNIADVPADARLSRAAQPVLAYRL